MQVTVPDTVGKVITAILVTVVLGTIGYLANQALAVGPLTRDIASLNESFSADMQALRREMITQDDIITAVENKFPTKEDVRRIEEAKIVLDARIAAIEWKLEALGTEVNSERSDMNEVFVKLNTFAIQLVEIKAELKSLADKKKEYEPGDPTNGS